MLTLNVNPLTYYTAQTVITQPGVQAVLFDALPTDLPGLHQIVQNVLVHVWKIRKYHAEWLTNRSGEIETRSIEQMLVSIQSLQPAPLTVTRPKERKLIVDCRHFATFLCALLRQQGIPARARSGFATYLEDTHYQDHWVCEYWNGERWVLEDPDLVKHDIPREQFITGGRAWQMARSGEKPAEQFGYGSMAHDRGWWVIRHVMIRDLAALNGYESLSSDSWGLLIKDEADVTLEDRTLLDQAAVFTLADNAGLSGVQAFYQNASELRVPDIIHSYNYITNTNHPVPSGIHMP
jgi:hypothetical protein